MRTLVYCTHYVTSTSSTSLKSKPLFSQPPTLVIIAAVSSVDEVKVGGGSATASIHLPTQRYLERVRKAALLVVATRTFKQPGF